MSSPTLLHRRPSISQQAEYSLAINSLSPLHRAAAATSLYPTPSSPATPTLSYYRSQRTVEMMSTVRWSWGMGGMNYKTWQFLSAAREVLVGTACALAAVSLVMNVRFFVQGKLHFSAQIGANAELIFASLLVLGTLLPLHFHFRPSQPFHLLSSLLSETLLLFILFIFFLSSSAYLQRVLPSLDHCVGISLCDQMRAIKILSWMETASLGASVNVMMVKGFLDGRWLEDFDALTRREWESAREVASEGQKE